MIKTKILDRVSYGSVNLESLPEGFVIDDRYEIIRKLGQGGFGAVYLVHDQQMDIEKALKILPEAFTHDEEAMADLLGEAKTMVSLNHPNIVRVYDLHSKGDIKYIDMEYIDGKTLTGLKLEYPDKRMPEKKVRELAIQISEGIAYAHENGVIHKDIKPQNVMVSSKGHIKIMDFGIAETVRMSMSRIDNTSTSGTMVYMSPEQLRGKDVGKESDIYSFGAMLYELLSGHPPFYRGDISYQIINEDPKPIENISPKMDYLISKCLSKDYHDRYSNFEEVQIELNMDDFSAEKPEYTENTVQAEDEEEIENTIEAQTAYDHDLESTTNDLNEEIEIGNKASDIAEKSQLTLESWQKKYKWIAVILGTLGLAMLIKSFDTYLGFKDLNYDRINDNWIAFNKMDYYFLVVLYGFFLTMFTGILFNINKRSLHTQSYGKITIRSIVGCSTLIFIILIGEEFRRDYIRFNYFPDPPGHLNEYAIIAILLGFTTTLILNYFILGSYRKYKPIPNERIRNSISKIAIFGTVVIIIIIMFIGLVIWGYAEKDINRPYVERDRVLRTIDYYAAQAEEYHRKTKAQGGGGGSFTYMRNVRPFSKKWLEGGVWGIYSISNVTTDKFTLTAEGKYRDFHIEVIINKDGEILIQNMVVTR